MSVAVASTQVVQNLIDAKIQKRESFTAYDITREARRQGVREHHGELKSVVHDYYKTASMQDYRQSLEPIPNTNQVAFVYYAPENSASQYIADLSQKIHTALAQPSTPAPGQTPNTAIDASQANDDVKDSDDEEEDEDEDLDEDEDNEDEDDEDDEDEDDDEDDNDVSIVHPQGDGFIRIPAAFVHQIRGARPGGTVKVELRGSTGKKNLIGKVDARYNVRVYRSSLEEVALNDIAVQIDVTKDNRLLLSAGE